MKVSSLQFRGGWGFEIGFHIAQVGLELLIWMRITVNFTISQLLRLQSTPPYPFLNVCNWSRMMCQQRWQQYKNYMRRAGETLQLTWFLSKAKVGLFEGRISKSKDVS